MFKNLTRRKFHSSPPAGEDPNPAKEEGITRGFVIKMVLVLAFVGPVISALITPFFDQAIRNNVDEWMSEADLFDSISISPKDYVELPLYWRQALAEIALRPKEEAVDAQNIIRNLKLADMKIIDLLAPYATHIGILRDDNQLSEHPMPELSYSDFSHLEDLGILEDVNNGREYHITEDLNPDSNIDIRGTTVTLRLRHNDPTNKLVIKTTAFTGGGRQIIEALRVPSNIMYFEWYAYTLEENGFTVELLAMGVEKGSMSETKEIQARIERHSLPAWTR